MNGNGAVSFKLTSEQKMIQDLAREFARNEIARSKSFTRTISLV